MITRRARRFSFPGGPGNDRLLIGQRTMLFAKHVQCPVIGMGFTWIAHVKDVIEVQWHLI
jgi:hypothetical protein